MKLIVGLGNPGKEYENTRHNTGFYFLDHYETLKNYTWKEKYHSLYVELTINHEKVIFIKPQTYMNNSGEAVAAFANYYHISTSDILIISDDLALPLGQYRLRSHGSCGGHNGLRSIEQHLHTDTYNRLRIGIASSTIHDTVSYVLGKFSIEEQTILSSLVDTVNQIITDYILLDFNELMNKYNHRK